MITLTTNWQLIKESYVGNAGGNVYIRLYAKYSEQDIINNRSYVYYQARLYYDGAYFYDQQSSFYVEGTGLNKVSGSKSDAYNSGETTLATTEGWITHETDGSKIVWARADINLPNWGIGNNANDDMQLPNIPRYATCNQSFNSKEENKIVINWSSDSICDYIWYSINGGAYWYAIGDINASSGTYTISGLSPNTTYNIQTLVRRKDSQLTTPSNTLQVTTYQFPDIMSATRNLTIGNGVDVIIYNPLGRPVDIFMRQTNTTGAVLYSTSYNTRTPETGLSFAFTPNSNTLYNSIPNSQNSDCVYYCVYWTTIANVVNGNYKIRGDELPIFNNFDYMDTDGIQGAVNNNQILVNGFSDCLFTISAINKAYSNYGASIVKYICQWGNVANEVGYSDNDVSCYCYDGSGNILTVVAIDSRGLQKPVIKYITNIPYQLLSISNIGTQRKDGVNTETYLSGNFNVWNGSWNSTDNPDYQNTLKYVGYSVFTNNEWSEYYDITSKVLEKARVSNYGGFLHYSFDFNDEIPIHLNGVDSGFPIGTEYPIKVYIKDGDNFATLSFNIIGNVEVTDGKVGMARYKDNNGKYHYGFGSMPSENQNFRFDGTFDIGDGAGYTTDNHGNFYAKNNSETGAFGFVGANGDPALIIFWNAKAVRTTRSFQIPLNGTPGYGLTNEAGNSIIRDHNNGCVTVDATGDTLFLGHQNTPNGINFLNGLCMMSGQGHFKLGNSDRNKTDTWIPVITNGWLTHTERRLPDGVCNTGWGNGDEDHLATMRFLSFWDGSYNGSASNLKYCVHGLLQGIHCLYYNEVGEAGTVTLADKCYNYKQIEIMFKKGDRYSSVRVAEPSSKVVSLSFSAFYDNNLIQMQNRSVALTEEYVWTYGLNGGINFGAGSVNLFNGDETLITCVLGWKG